MATTSVIIRNRHTGAIAWQGAKSVFSRGIGTTGYNWIHEQGDFLNNSLLWRRLAPFKGEHVENGEWAITVLRDSGIAREGAQFIADEDFTDTYANFERAWVLPSPKGELWQSTGRTSGRFR